MLAQISPYFNVYGIISIILILHIRTLKTGALKDWMTSKYHTYSRERSPSSMPFYTTLISTHTSEKCWALKFVECKEEERRAVQGISWPTVKMITIIKNNLLLHFCTALLTAGMLLITWRMHKRHKDWFRHKAAWMSPLVHKGDIIPMQLQQCRLANTGSSQDHAL